MKMMSRTRNVLPLGVVLSCLLPLIREARATILLIGNETELSPPVSYPSMDAIFTSAIPEAGILGEAYAADPLDGCSAFTFEVGDKIAFAVVQRGDCSFVDKVRNSQNAGFAAAIVYDSADDRKLVAMSGDGAGITAYALFVSKAAGESLLSLEGGVYILPGYKRKTWAITWLIVSVFLIVVFIVGALVTALCCIRAHILADAQKQLEKEELNENLLHDDDYILNREFIPDDNGLDSLEPQDVMADINRQNNEARSSEGSSESDPYQKVQMGTAVH